METHSACVTLTAKIKDLTLKEVQIEERNIKKKMKDKNEYKNEVIIAKCETMVLYPSIEII